MTQFITDSMGTNLLKSSSNLIEGIAPVFSILFGIYLLLILLSFWEGGGISEMFVDFIKRMFVWAFLIGLAFNAGHYAELGEWIYALPDDLAKVFGNIEYSGGALDKIVDDVNVVTDTLVEQQNNLDWGDVGPYLSYTIAINGIEIIMGLALVVLFAFYILAKASLALSLMVGPLFIAFGLFPATRQYSMNWIGQCLNYVFSTVFLSLIGSMMLNFINTYIDIKGVADLASASFLLLQLVLVAFVFLIVTLGIPQLASALMGGASIPLSGRTMYSMARGGVTSPYKAYKTLSKLFGGKGSGGNITPK